SEPANERVVAFMDAVEEPEAPGQTVERLVGVYRVLKPHLLASYHDHLIRANPVYEPPTRRLLLRCLGDERRHIAAGTTILGHLCATPALAERALAWQRRLEGLFAAAGGVTGEGLPPAPVDTAQAPIETSDDARELVRLQKPLACWWPIGGRSRGACSAPADRWASGPSPSAQRRAAIECRPPGTGAHADDRPRSVRWLRRSRHTSRGSCSRSLRGRVSASPPATR